MSKSRHESIAMPADMFAEIRALAGGWDRSITHTIGVLLTRGLRDAQQIGVCRDCGCTNQDACTDDDTGESCHWVAEDLCSACDLPMGN